MELYIKKWWGNYVGGCDDTFLLLDYFGSQKQSNLELSKILSDIHLNTLLKENSVNEGDIYFSINESYEPHFDMAIDVIIDLSAILLESIKNGKVDIKELDPNSKYSNFFSISTSKDGSVSKSVSGRNSKKGPAKILTGPNKFVILGDKT